MSDTQDPNEVADKGRRLASMISMGFGYFKAKQSLESHDWNVEDAAASVLSEECQDGKVASVGKEKSREREKKTAAKSLAVALKNDGPQLLPDSVGKPASRQYKRDEPPFQAHHDVDGVASHPPDHEYMDSKSLAARGTSEEGVEEKRNVALPAVDVEEPDEDSPPRSMPGAFREGPGCDEDTTTDWDSMVWSQSTLQDPPSPGTYMAVAEVVTVPELVDAIPLEPAESASASAQEPADSPPEAAIGASDKPMMQETGWMPRHRHLYLLLMVVLLVLIGLVTGLVVSQRHSSSRVGQIVGAGQESPTTLPVIEPSTSSSTVSPTSRPTQMPTSSPTTTRTTSPTSRPTPLPTDFPATTSTPVPPSTASLTESPTEPPTSPPTQRPTHLPTSQPSLSPTTSSTASLSPPPSGLFEELRVEEIEMALTGVPLLNSDALKLWIQATIDFVLAEVEQALVAESDGSYDYYVEVHLTFDSQAMDSNKRLNLIFSLEFLIRSSLETHDVNMYVRGAFDSDTERLAYIKELKATADSSFANATDVDIDL